MGRAPCCDKEKVKKGPWSPEEDAKLKAYIEEHGTCGNWIALPHKIGLKRCGKSCRLRWLNYLRPNIKHGGFTDEEDQLICSLYISIGSRWSIIAAQLPGRTDNDIKNYWNTRLKKKLLGRRNEPSQSQNLCSNQIPSTKQVNINGVNDEAPNSQTLSASALERMQLYMHLQSLYNNPIFYSNPPLWPKYHPPGDQKIHHPIDASLVKQVNYNSHASIQPPLGKTDMTIHEEVDCWSFGFNSPLSRELQADLSYVGHEQEHQLDELDCYKEICKEKESANWSSSNDFDDSTISTFHADSMIQEYALQYDL